MTLVAIQKKRDSRRCDVDGEEDKQRSQTNPFVPTWCCFRNTFTNGILPVWSSKERTSDVPEKTKWFAGGHLRHEALQVILHKTEAFLELQRSAARLEHLMKAWLQ